MASETTLMLAQEFTASDNPSRLVIAALLGVATIVVLITVTKLHPFLSLMFGSVVMALAAGVPLISTFDSFTSGLGSTIGGVGVLVVLGAMIGELLIKSGGADRIVDTIIGRAKVSMLPWAMALIAFIIGIPLFFEVGVVLMIPVVMMVARRMKLPVIAIGIPALAGLSALHAFVPPHPGPLLAIDALGANLGLTLGIGLLVAIPTVILAGPVAARFMVRYVPIMAPETFDAGNTEIPENERPSFGSALTIILIPVGLMLLNAVVEVGGWTIPGLNDLVAFFGQPIVALLSAVLYGIFAFGIFKGKKLQEVSDVIGGSFAPIASILLIVGAGGGFKQTLVDSGIGEVIGQWLAAQPISPLLAGWLLAVFIRVATGSATVATITAAGIVAPLAAGLDTFDTALMVLAVGAGSNFFSHVNDAGFWLVKEYFRMTVGQTLKTWSVMTTITSVFGLFAVMMLHWIF